VVIDEARRVLLVRFQFPDRHLWAMPGGGIDAGESPEEAIRRELDEEVGLRGVELGPVVWERTHLFPLSDHHDGQRETFFLVHASVEQSAPALSADRLLASKVLRRLGVEQRTTRRAVVNAVSRLHAKLAKPTPPAPPSDTTLELILERLTA